MENICVDSLMYYQKLKKHVEGQAECVFKKYCKDNQIEFPTDFGIEGVEIIDKDTVCVNYYGWQNYDEIYFSMEYFLNILK